MSDQNDKTGADSASPAFMPGSSEGAAATPTAPADQPSQPSAGHGAPVNRFVIWFLLVITTLFTTTALSAVWVARTVTDTDNFVAAVAPLADDPAIQQAIANRTSERIIRALEPEQQIKKVLPDQLDILAGPLAGGIEAIVRRQAEAVVESDSFTELWRETARVSHAGVMGAIEGREGTVSVDRGVVSLNLAPITEKVEERLSETGLSRLDLSGITDRVPEEVVLAESKALGTAAAIVDFLKTVAWWSLGLALVTAIATVVAHSNRRQGALRVGVAIMIAGLLPVLGISFGRVLAIEPMLGPLAANPEVPAAAYSVVTNGLATAGRGLAFLGALLALGMYLLGSSDRAVSVRGSVSRKVAATGGDYGQVGLWVIDHRSTLRLAGIAIAAVILIAANQLSVTTIFLVGVFLAAYLIALELPKRPNGTD